MGMKLIKYPHVYQTDLKVSECPGAFGVHDALWNALAVKVRNLL